MKKPGRVLRAEAQMVDGTLCFVLIGKDGEGRPVQLAIPEHGLQPVFADAERRLLAYRAQEGRQQAGDYYSTITSPGTPAQVGTMETTEGEIVVLIVRKGTPSEMNLSFSPPNARGLARELTLAVDQIEREAKAPASKH